MRFGSLREPQQPQLPQTTTTETKPSQLSSDSPYLCLIAWLTLFGTSLLICIFIYASVYSLISPETLVSYMIAFPCGALFKDPEFRSGYKKFKIISALLFLSLVFSCFADTNKRKDDDLKTTAELITIFVNLFGVSMFFAFGYLLKGYLIIHRTRLDRVVAKISEKKGMLSGDEFKLASKENWSSEVDLEANKEFGNNSANSNLSGWFDLGYHGNSLDYNRLDWTSSTKFPHGPELGRGYGSTCMTEPAN